MLSAVIVTSMRAAPRPFCRAVLSTTIHSIFLFDSSSSGARNAPSSVPPWCAHTDLSSYRADRDRVPNVGTGRSERSELRPPSSSSKVLVSIDNARGGDMRCTSPAMRIVGVESRCCCLKPEVPAALLAATAPAAAPAAAPVAPDTVPAALAAPAAPAAPAAVSRGPSVYIEPTVL
jgi:hypothetical protein